ncbi:MAG: alanine racemase [Symbiobacteriaceae bacterium]|nr:alanine racemase [Symbiobacteriaceae bacterium]
MQADYDIGYSNSYLLVDLGIIRKNIAKIRAHIGAQVDILAILKGNAYGLGLVEMGRFLTRECGIKFVGNAQVAEALQLIEGGVQCDILVIGGVPFHNIPAVVAHDLVTPAYSLEYLTRLDGEAKKQGKIARVKIKVETGLNRIGVWPGEELEQLLTGLKQLPNLQVIGAFTHFSYAEAVDKSFTREQYAYFKQGVQQIQDQGWELPYIHAFNTAASVWLQDSLVTHIRPAALLFGYDSNMDIDNALQLEESVTWRTFITHVKTVPAGETVGYSRYFKVTKATEVATISVGYGDGYLRSLAMQGKPDMLVGGQRAPVIGTCMDQTFLDVTGLGAKIDDPVTIIGRDGAEYISAYELEEKMGQTFLAMLATVSPRVKRVYIGGKS